MKRHPKGAGVERAPHEPCYKIEGRDDEDDEYWHKKEEPVMARYNADEKTSDRDGEVKAEAKKTGRKAGKGPASV